MCAACIWLIHRSSSGSGSGSGSGGGAGGDDASARGAPAAPWSCPHCGIVQNATSEALLGGRASCAVVKPLRAGALPVLQTLYRRLVVAASGGGAAADAAPDCATLLRLDPAISLGIAALVGWSTVSFARQSLALSMDAVPDAIDPAEVERLLRALPGVTGLHDLHVWPLGSSGAALSAHLEMPAGHPGDAFLVEARASLERRFGIGHVTLQIETGSDCPQDCARDR
jgi:hypothetical protein